MENNPSLIIKQEKQLLARVDSIAALSNLIDDEFEERTKSGIHDKKEAIRWLSQDIDIEITGMQFNAKFISDDVVLLTYISKSRMKNSVDCNLALRVSIWRFKNHCWRLISHQGTPIPD